MGYATKASQEYIVQVLGNTARLLSAPGYWVAGSIFGKVGKSLVDTFLEKVHSLLSNWSTSDNQKPYTVIKRRSIVTPLLSPENSEPSTPRVTRESRISRSTASGSDSGSHSGFWLPKKSGSIKSSQTGIEYSKSILDKLLDHGLIKTLPKDLIAHIDRLLVEIHTEISTLFKNEIRTLFKKDNDSFINAIPVFNEKIYELPEKDKYLYIDREEIGTETLRKEYIILIKIIYSVFKHCAEQQPNDSSSDKVDEIYNKFATIEQRLGLLRIEK